MLSELPRRTLPASAWNSGAACWFRAVDGCGLLNLVGDSMDLIEHMIESAKTNPRMAKGLRELLVKGLGEHPEGSESHDSLLATLNSLDTFIAVEGDGYSKDRVTGDVKCF